MCSLQIYLESLFSFEMIKTHTKEKTKDFKAFVLQININVCKDVIGSKIFILTYFLNISANLHPTSPTTSSWLWSHIVWHKYSMMNPRMINMKKFNWQSWEAQIFEDASRWYGPQLSYGFAESNYRNLTEGRGWTPFTSYESGKGTFELNCKCCIEINSINFENFYFSERTLWHDELVHL